MHRLARSTFLSRVGASGALRGSRSALARPQQHAAYADPLDPVHLAAVYTAGIVKNHPFIDGNKRTGFVLGVLFLELTANVASERV